MIDDWTKTQRVRLVEYIRTGQSDGRKSCFRALLKDARRAAYRNSQNGAPRWTMPEDRLERGSGLWTTALLYLVLVDHIGNCFVDRPKRMTAADHFCATVSRFATPSLEREQQDALYNLRCALAHSYSLTGRSQSKQRASDLFSALWAKPSASVRIIDVQADRWSGTYDEDAPPSVVNLYALEELVEQIARRVESEVGSEVLLPVLPYAEFEVDFTFQVTIEIIDGVSVSASGAGDISVRTKRVNY